MQPRRWLSGAGVALASAAIYSIALGFFLALMLLVISMEEGGDNLSQLAIPLSEAIVLLSQGIGFEAGSITLTIMPLLLTLLLIGLIRSFAVHFGASSWQEYIAGAAVWMAINAVFTQGVSVGLLDPTWKICLKTYIVFTLGFALNAAPASQGLRRLTELARSRVSAPLRKAVAVGLKIGGLLIALYLLFGLITAATWAVRGNGAIVRLFELSGMQTGSRIFTVICSLAWLPNIGIWAISWLFGGGFAIGDLATFTLWSGRATGLPPLPVFAMLPEPVASDAMRNILVSIPLACGLVVGIAALVASRGFAIRFIRGDDSARAVDGGFADGAAADKAAGASGWRQAAIQFAYAAGGFCVASVATSLGMTLLLAVSNGSLGRQRLGYIGVDVMASTQRIGQPSVSGLFIAWLAVLIVVSAVFVVRLALARRLPAGGTAARIIGGHSGGRVGDGFDINVGDDGDIADRGTGIIDDDTGDNTENGPAGGKTGKGTRPVNSTLGSGAGASFVSDKISRRVISSMTTPKEDHDDDNSATDTTSPGFRLP